MNTGYRSIKIRPGVEPEWALEGLNHALESGGIPEEGIYRGVLIIGRGCDLLIYKTKTLYVIRDANESVGHANL